MNCTTVHDLLTRYLLGDLDPARHAAVKQHLETCEACRATARDIEPTLGLLRDALAASVEIPQGLSAAQRARVLHRPTRMRRVIRWVVSPQAILVRAAAVLIILLLFAGLFMPALSSSRERARRTASMPPREVYGLHFGKGPAASEIAVSAIEPEAIEELAELDNWKDDTVVTGGGKLAEAGGDKSEAGDAFGSFLNDMEISVVNEDEDPFGDDYSAGFTLEAGQNVTMNGSGADIAGGLKSVRATGRTLNTEPPAPQAAPDIAYGYAGSGTLGGLDGRDRDIEEIPPEQIAQTRADSGSAYYRRLPAFSPAPAEPDEASDPMDEDEGLVELQLDLPPPVFMGTPKNFRFGGRAAAMQDRAYEGKKDPDTPVAGAEIAPMLEDADSDGLPDTYEANTPTSTTRDWGIDALAAQASAAPSEEHEEMGGDDDGKPKPTTASPLDSISTVKSPVTMRGILASRSAGMRGKGKDDLLGDLSDAPGTGKRKGSEFVSMSGESSAREREEEHKEEDRRIAERDAAAHREDLRRQKLEKAAKQDGETEVRKASFRAYGVNPFVNAAKQAFSTFAIDVDTASYTLARNMMVRGTLPPAEAVRTEEFVNFFDDNTRPPDRGTFRITAEGAPSRFGRGLHLLKLDVKGRRLGREEQRPAMLTFLIDTSGSMDTPDRIELVKTALTLLVNRLAPSDQVAIVQYSSQARLVLPPTPLNQRARILKAIDALQCSGSTNLEQGMKLAYQAARGSFAPGAENRVLLLSDGVANLGESDAEQILAMVHTARKQGIFCSVMGFGSGTYDDVMLETLANKGDGNYAFIDSEAEARRVFVDDLAATLNTIASDVKIQVEFNPARVRRYRQLGYENRRLRKQDFRNDAVDAGEVGSGQSVTALYECDLLPRPAPHHAHDTVMPYDTLGIVRVRYRRIDTGKVEEIERTLRDRDLVAQFDQASLHFRLVAAVAEFAEILRGSPFSKGSRYEDVARVLRPIALELTLDTRVQELLHLVQGAEGMPRP